MLTRAARTVEEVGTVRRISVPSREAFESEYLATGTPIIIQGALTKWKAMTAWTHEYLRATVGSKRVALSVPSPSDDRTYHLLAEDGKVVVPRHEMTFANYLTSLEETHQPQRRLYLAQTPIAETFPELAPDFDVPEVIHRESMKFVNMWFGGDGNISPLHFDQLNNLLAQLTGSKRFSLYDPSQCDALYPRESPLCHMSQVDIDRPDYDRFPNLRGARRLDCVVEPGEVLFLPAYWWHQVYSVGECMALNFWWKPLLAQCLLPGALNLETVASLCPSPDLWGQSLYPTDKGTPLDAARYLQSTGHPSWLVVVFLAVALEVQLHRLVTGEARGIAPPASRIARWRGQMRRAFTERNAVFSVDEIDALMDGIETFVFQR